MLKVGIWKPEQDTPAGRFLRRGLSAATLLLDQRTSDASTDPELFDRITRQICLSNGVARTTTRERFCQLNVRVRQVLQALYPPRSPLSVEDWACSTGITSLEWFRDLLPDYPAVRFAASDWILYLIGASIPDKSITYILEPDGTPIQYISPPFVVSMVRPNLWAYPLNVMVQRQARRNWNTLYSSRLQLPDYDCFTASLSPVSVPPFQLRYVRLIHPEVCAIRDEQFQIRRHSVFEALAQPVDVIRTMNILNRAYFDEDRLGKAADAVHASLRPGGVWIVGRTSVDDVFEEDVSVFRRHTLGWELLTRADRGSEIERLVMSRSAASR
jgi:hypothetical protein